MKQTNREAQWLLGGETLARCGGLEGALWLWSHCSPTLTERRRNGAAWRRKETQPQHTRSHHGHVVNTWKIL